MKKVPCNNTRLKDASVPTQLAFDFNEGEKPKKRSIIRKASRKAARKSRRVSIECEDTYAAFAELMTAIQARRDKRNSVPSDSGELDQSNDASSLPISIAELDEEFTISRE